MSTKNNQAKFGVDVAVMRSDDLDRKMTQVVTQKMEALHGKAEIPCTSCTDLESLNVLDLGCGGGGQSFRLVQAGARVLGVDVGDYAGVFEKLRAKNSVSINRLRFIQGSVRSLDKVVADKDFDVCCFQRTLHYLPYDDAQKVLHDLHRYIHPEGKLYISVTGLESDIGRNYADKDKKIEDRFHCLTDEDVEVFNISEPLCLYTPEEFITLLQGAQWCIEECWISAFGNIKAVCTQDKVV